jgi:hypothetical protein
VNFTLPIFILHCFKVSQYLNCQNYFVYLGRQKAEKYEALYKIYGQLAVQNDGEGRT